MVGSQWTLTAGAGVVLPAGAGIALGCDAGLGRIEMRLQGLFEGVERLAHLPLLGTGNGAETLIELLEQALPAEMRNAECLQRLRVGYVRPFGLGEQPVQLRLVQCVHALFS